jgi:hypothetical protein
MQRDLLVAHGIEACDPETVLTSPALLKVCDDLTALTEAHFVQAARAMAKCSRATMRRAWVGDRDLPAAFTPAYGARLEIRFSA